MPGQGEEMLRAVCTDEISTRVKAPSLKSVVQSFKVRGHRLADKHLNSDVIDDITILLGSDQGHIFPLTQQNFSVEGKAPSTIFVTPSGIMLSGSASLYLSNIDALPNPPGRESLCLTVNNTVSSFSQ